MNLKSLILMGTGLVLASGSGFLASRALGLGAQAPTVTTTVNIPTGGSTVPGPPGPQGPPGPKGEPGTPGAESCPTGSTFKAVLFNAPGGQTTIYTCVKN